jgi:signal transduction histidine kinase
MVAGDPGAAEVLVHFARLAAEAKSASEILPLLAESAVDTLRADGAAVLQIGERGQMRAVASRNLPSELANWEVEAETIGQELGVALLGACGDLFGGATTLPLVAGGDLYGALVLLARDGRPLDAERQAIAEAHADLAALAIRQATQRAELEQSLSQLRAARDAIQRTEKLRALGQMAAGISHDLRNVLNPMSLHVQLLRRRLDKERQGLGESLTELDDAIHHGVATVDRLREFSRQAPERASEPTDLAGAVASAFELCGPRLHQHPGIRATRQDGASCAIQVRREDLVNAIVNLVTNAVEATAPEGNVVVRTGVDGGGGWVEVEDDGPGMPPEIESRVFEPFFTTKGEGTGLGLAMVYAFVQRHDGTVELHTAPGKGTRIRMRFPAAA